MEVMMLTDFAKLETFLTVVREKSFSKASAKLGISQPAVTQQMKFIEDYLDVQIVDRKKNGIKLTKEGQILQAIALKIEKCVTNGEKELLKIMNKNVAFIVIRPQRYTREFVESSDSFSITFFDESYLKGLSYLGRVSGRNENKIEKANLTVATEDNIPYFQEANTAIFAKKLFVQHFEESSYLDKSIIERWHPEKDFHYLYIGEITKILVKE